MHHMETAIATARKAVSTMLLITNSVLMTHQEPPAPISHAPQCEHCMNSNHDGTDYREVLSFRHVLLIHDMLHACRTALQQRLVP